MNTECSAARLKSALAGSLPADDEAALQQHLFWGWLISFLAVLGMGQWSLDAYWARQTNR